MANQYEIKSLSQCSTAEEYARRLILISFQPILSLIDDIFETRDPTIFNNVGLVRFLRRYSGCQKNIAVFKRFFLQPLMPQFRHSEHYYGKRYIVFVKKTLRYSDVFFYNHLYRNSVIRNIIMESGIKPVHVFGHYKRRTL